MGSLQEILLIAIGIGAIWLGVRLFRQGHPGDEVDRDLPEDPGPTGEPYPTGSRPAGPGAERMTAEPSATESEQSDQDESSDEMGSQSGPD